MVHLIETESEDMYTYIKLFAHRLTMTPTPPPGRVAIVSTYCNHPSTLLGRVAIVSMVKYPKQPPPHHPQQELQLQVPIANYPK